MQDRPRAPEQPVLVAPSPEHQGGERATPPPDDPYEYKDDKLEQQKEEASERHTSWHEGNIQRIIHSALDERGDEGQTAEREGRIARGDEKHVAGDEAEDGAEGNDHHRAIYGLAGC